MGETTDDKAGLARTARLDVLVEGYARLPHVAGTACLSSSATTTSTTP